MKSKLLLSFLIFLSTNLFAYTIPLGSGEITSTNPSTSIMLDGIYQSKPNQMFLLTCHIADKFPLENTLFLRSFYPPQNIVLDIHSVENCNGKICSATWLQPGTNNDYTYYHIATSARGSDISFSVIDFPKNIDIKISCYGELVK